MGGIKDLSDEELLALAKQPRASTAPARRPLSELSDDELEQLARAPKQKPTPAPTTGASLLEQQNAQDRATAEHEQQLQAEYGGIGGQIAAGVEGGLRGLSLGATDAISAGAQALGLQSGMGDYQPTRLTPEAREKIAAYNKAHPDKPIDTTGSDRGNLAIAYDLAREGQDARAAANPVTSTLSEVTGATIPALASGGTSLAARGAMATPAGLLGRGGAAITAGLAPEGASVLRTGLAHAIAGATEGGLANLALMASHIRAADIENPGQAAESLAYATATGSLLGGVLGGALGAGGAYLGQRRAAARVAGELDAQPAPIASPIEQKVAQVEQLQHARTGVAQVDDAVDQEAGNLLHEATQELETRPLTAAQVPQKPRGFFDRLSDQARAAQAFDDAVASGTQQARAHLDDALRDMDAIDAFGGIAAKRKANAFNVGHKVDATPFHEAIDGMEAEVNAFMKGRSRAGLASGGGLGALESLKKDFAENRKLITEALDRGDVGEAYNLFDQGVKGRLGKIGDGTKNEGVRALMENLYDRPQKFLEDESLFGELAQRQKLANPSWANRIQAGNDQRVQGLMVKRTNERSNKMFRDQTLANDQALASMLRTIGDPGSAGAEEATRTWLRSMARDATDRMRAWGSPELQERAARVVDRVTKIENVMDHVGQLKMDKLAHERAMKGSTLEMLGQAAANFGPNPVSAALNMAVNAKRQIVQMLGRQTTAEGRAAVESAIPPPTPLEQTVQVANQTMAARVAKSAGTLLRTIGSAKDGTPIAAGIAANGMLPEDKHNQAVQQAIALSKPGSPETAALLDQGAQIEKESPDLAHVYVQKQVQAANYIASRVPQQTSSALWAPGVTMDPISDRRFRRIVAAVRNPEAALDRIASGRGTPEEQEAVRTLKPEMFATFQQGVKAELAKLKKPPDLETRLRIAYATGLNVDPSMEGNALTWAQQVASMPDQAKAEEAKAEAKNKASAAQLGDPYQTGSDEKFKPGKFRDADSVYASPVDRMIDRR